MTDVDISTGLPALPDGQFWRVAKFDNKTPNYSVFGNAYLESVYRPEELAPYATLQLIAKVARTVNEPVSYKFGHGPKSKKPIPTTFKVVVSEVEEVVASQYIAVMEQLLPPFYNGEDTKSHTARTKAWDKQEAEFLEKHPKGGRIWSGSSMYIDHDQWLVDPTVTPQRILETANKILAAEIEKRRVEEENRLAKEKAEREAKEKQALRDFYLGDYPPRILLP